LALLAASPTTAREISLAVENLVANESEGKPEWQMASKKP